MSGNPFQSTPEQLAVAIGYKNAELIADKLMPRARVAKQKFKWHEFNERDGFGATDDKIGRKSAPNQLSFGSKERVGETQDRGYTTIIPFNDEKDIAGDGLPRIVNRSTQLITRTIHNRREARVSDIVTSADNYTHKVDVATAKRFSNVEYNPIPEMIEYLNTPIMRPNTAVFGQKAWSSFRTNPFVVSAALGNSGQAGAASREAVRDLLEVRDVLVGSAFVDVAKPGPGKKAQLQRIWGPHAAFLYLDDLGGDEDQEVLTWGFTAQYENWVTGSRELPGIGLRGATEVKCGESVEEIVAAKGAGFLMRNVIA